jgi:large subunit ribosomal protein L13
MREIKLDAKDKIIGRLATQIAVLLQGKDLPEYNPRLVGNTRVLIENVEKAKFSGKKFDNKLYRHHTGYTGHLKTYTAKQVFEKDKTMLLKKAVMGMLPKNKLRSIRIKNLIFV